MISPSSPVSLGRGNDGSEVSALFHGWICIRQRSNQKDAKKGLTLEKRSRLVGNTKPVVAPIAVLVETQPFSSSSSAPRRPVDSRPRTKKPVLLHQLYITVITHPRMLKTGDCSAISTIASMISSSSKNCTPPSVDPMLPYFVSNARLDNQK